MAPTPTASCDASCPRRLWIFDEIHKYRSWRGYLKGLHDVRRRGQRILVTGSARLDFYRFGGDSLQGRYHLLRLHPFSVAELGLRLALRLPELVGSPLSINALREDLQVSHKTVAGWFRVLERQPRSSSCARWCDPATCRELRVRFWTPSRPWPLDSALACGRRFVPEVT